MFRLFFFSETAEGSPLCSDSDTTGLSPLTPSTENKISCFLPPARRQRQALPQHTNANGFHIPTSQGRLLPASFIPSYHLFTPPVREHHTSGRYTCSLHCTSSRSAGLERSWHGFFPRARVVGAAAADGRGWGGSGGPFLPWSQFPAGPRR